MIFFFFLIFAQFHLYFFTTILQNNFKPPKSIRGGIPICFPQVCVSICVCILFVNSVSLFSVLLICVLQFSNHGSLQQHGFARNRFWSLDPNPPPFPTATTNRAFIDLILRHSEDDAKHWPHRYTVLP